uniref:Uncharacterized protein n=2 Tax=Aegilops tauschii subsp. strangulata TaxID=200361 RepID=A0A453E4L5_AEGTS
SNPLLLLTHGTSFLLPLPLSQTHWRRRLEAQHCTRRPARGAALPPAHRLRLLPRLPVDLKKGSPFGFDLTGGLLILWSTIRAALLRGHDFVLVSGEQPRSDVLCSARCWKKNFVFQENNKLREELFRGLYLFMQTWFYLFH